MKNILKVLIVLTPFMLTGCGEGWEQVRTDSYVPYGNSRTAGTGIAYVRAKMLPKKELNLKSVARERQPEAVVVEPKPVMQQVDRLFKEAQEK